MPSAVPSHCTIIMSLLYNSTFRFKLRVTVDIVQSGEKSAAVIVFRNVEFLFKSQFHGNGCTQKWIEMKTEQRERDPGSS